jgi:hypothetical protein
VGLDVKAMRTQAGSPVTDHLRTSRELFLHLEGTRRAADARDIEAVVLLAVDAASGTSASVRRALERFDEETALASLESDAAFLLLTEPIGPRSILVGGDIGSEAIAPDGSLAARAASGKAIFEVRLDGRPYEREGRRLCIQDEAGLLNLNTQDEGALARLIAEIDPDNAERLAGSDVQIDMTDRPELAGLGVLATQHRGLERAAARRGNRETPPKITSAYLPRLDSAHNSIAIWSSLRRSTQMPSRLNVGPTTRQ